MVSPPKTFTLTINFGRMIDFLTGFFAFLLISGVFRYILIASKKRFSSISTQYSGADIYKSAGNDYDSILNIKPILANTLAPKEDEFRVLDYMEIEHKNIYSIAKAIYIEALYFKTKQGAFLSKLMLFFQNYHLILDKYLPPFLFAGLIYDFIFDEYGFLGVIWVVFFTNILFSFFLVLLNIFLVMSLPKQLTLRFTLKEEGEIKKCMLIIHFSTFFRSWGVFWKAVDIFRWLFKND